MSLQTHPRHPRGQVLENRDGFYDVSSWDRNVGEDVDQTFDYGIRLLVDTAQIYSVRDL